jgi:hypothetical protein
VDADRIADGLLDASLPQVEWTHAAHVTAAHTLVRRLGPQRALVAVRAAIPRLNDAHGVPNSDSDGYHETLTVFFMAAVAACVARGLDLDATLAAMTRDAPLAYWSRDVLFSVAARHGYVPPDLAAPPFPVSL